MQPLEVGLGRCSGGSEAGPVPVSWLLVTLSGIGLPGCAQEMRSVVCSLAHSRHQAKWHRRLPARYRRETHSGVRSEMESEIGPRQTKIDDPRERD
jgi:hypothetical protein